MRHHLRDLLTLAAGTIAAVILVRAGFATRPNPETLLRGSVSSLQELAGFTAAAAGLGIAVVWSVGLAMAVAYAGLRKAGHAAAAAAAGALAPAFMKRLAVAVIGLNLVSGTGGAQAAEFFPQGSQPPAISSFEQPPQTVRPQWNPAAADGNDEHPTPHWKPRAAPDAQNVFVRPGRPETESQAVVQEGDSLWSLASAQLGPQATEADIAAHWPRWYERNRAVIGDSPDLILPGQVFEIPDAPETPPRH